MIKTLYGQAYIDLYSLYLYAFNVDKERVVQIVWHKISTREGETFRRLRSIVWFSGGAVLIVADGESLHRVSQQ